MCHAHVDGYDHEPEAASLTKRPWQASRRAFDHLAPSAAKGTRGIRPDQEQSFTLRPPRRE
eukprot:832742-Prymnesium_polylepis.1